MRIPVSFLLILLLLSLGVSGLAADAGVITIPGEDEEIMSVTLDDLKIGTIAKIPSYAEITLTKFTFEEKLGYYWRNHLWGESNWESGTTADFALLKFSVLNLATKNVDFLNEISNISFTFTYKNDEYRFGGWRYQIHSEGDRNVVLADEERSLNYEIQPFYEGYFLVGGDLPNLVVRSKEPLRLTFNIGEHEITYHIRK